MQRVANISKNCSTIYRTSYAKTLLCNQSVLQYSSRSITNDKLTIPKLNNINQLSRTGYQCGLNCNRTYLTDGKYRGPEREHLVGLTESPKNRNNYFYTQDMDLPAAGSIKHFTVLGVILSMAMAGVFDYIYGVTIGAPHEDMGAVLPHKEMKTDRLDGNSMIAKAKCATEKHTEGTEEDYDNLVEKNDEQIKKHIGFRDRKMIAYEDRVRSYSTPDKIFRYFATLRYVHDGHEYIFMTPDDFVRSITPGLQQPSNLGLDSYKRFDPTKKTDKLNLQLSKDSVFYKIGDKALISFSDYIFLLTVLSTPQRQFEIAFRMFDLNGDGELDAGEFAVVSDVIRGTTAIGKRHRDHGVTGNTIGSINSALTHYFFGEDGKQKLNVSTFLQFQRQLQMEITKLEFDRYTPVNGRITELDFADALLKYAGFHVNKTKKMKKRIKQKFDPEESPGITFDDYVKFSKLLRNISDVDTALTFYNLAGAAIDQPTLKHVTKSVANIELSDHLLDVVFTLFDENNDGQLSNKEFMAVMKNRLLRGLDRPMDTGFVRFLNAVFKCTKEQMEININALTRPK